jgi:hypothetical protein
MRDDVWKLPLSGKAKRYARRRGLRSMMRQPDDFVAVNAELTNPGKPNVFKNRDAVGLVKKSMKGYHGESRARKIIKLMLEKKINGIEEKAIFAKKKFGELKLNQIFTASLWKSGERIKFVKRDSKTATPYEHFVKHGHPRGWGYGRTQFYSDDKVIGHNK